MEPCRNRRRQNVMIMVQLFETSWFDSLNPRLNYPYEVCTQPQASLIRCSRFPCGLTAAAVPSGACQHPWPLGVEVLCATLKLTALAIDEPACHVLQLISLFQGFYSSGR